MEPENDGLEVVDNTVQDEPEKVEEAPSEAPAEETEEVAEETPSEPEVESETETPLYELPDGRKVDAETLSKEWKENFLPDYTRKSQKIAEIEKAPIQNNETKAPWEDPEWTPESAQEILDAAVAKLEAKQVAERTAQDNHRRLVEQTVEGELGEIKTLDPKVDENQVFQHATKYGFNSLVHAYRNMKDMAAQVKTVEKKTVQNLQKRAADPVATGTPAIPDTSDIYESNMSNRSMAEIAHEALAKLKGK